MTDTTNHAEVIREAIRGAYVNPERILAALDALTRELAQAKKDLVMGPRLEVITHEHVAQAVREERERIIATLTGAKKGGDLAAYEWTWAGPKGFAVSESILRAALAPKEAQG